MDLFGDGAKVVIAGASGLVGNELITQLVDLTAVHSLYALVRNPLPLEHDKLYQIQDSQLRITQWDQQHTADFGFICLGTTKKQAGSNKALESIDVDLVCQVAQTMKMIGVKRIAVVSSYGAKINSLSHYLRCKGKMEKSILNMGFERVVFVRPGPLAGHRIPARKDELVTAKILALLRPLLIGPLANMIPIDANDVATAMLYGTFKPQHSAKDNYVTMNSQEMHQLLDKYRSNTH